MASPNSQGKVPEHTLKSRLSTSSRSCPYDSQAMCCTPFPHAFSGPALLVFFQLLKFSLLQTSHLVLLKIASISFLLSLCFSFKYLDLFLIAVLISLPTNSIIFIIFKPILLINFSPGYVLFFNTFSLFDWMMYILNFMLSSVQILLPFFKEFSTLFCSVRKLSVVHFTLFKLILSFFLRGAGLLVTLTLGIVQPYY